MRINNQKDFTNRIDDFIKDGIRNPHGNAWAKINNLCHKYHEQHYLLNDTQKLRLASIKSGKNLTPEEQSIITRIVNINERIRPTRLEVEKAPTQSTQAIAQSHVTPQIWADELIDMIQFGDETGIYSLMNQLNRGMKLSSDQIERIQLIKIDQGETKRLLNKLTFIAINNENNVKLSSIEDDGKVDKKELNQIRALVEQAKNHSHENLEKHFKILQKNIPYLTDATLKGNKEAKHILFDILRLDRFSEANEYKDFLNENLSIWGLGRILSYYSEDASQLTFKEGKKRGDFYCTQDVNDQNSINFQINLIRRDPENKKAKLEASLKILKYANDPKTHFELAIHTNDKKKRLNHMLIAALNGHMGATTEVINNVKSIRLEDIDRLATHRSKLADVQRALIKGFILENQGKKQEAKKCFEYAALLGNPLAVVHCFVHYGQQSKNLSVEDAIQNMKRSINSTVLQTYIELYPILSNETDSY